MCMDDLACVLSSVLLFAGSYGTLCATGVAYALGARQRIVWSIFALGFALTILGAIAIATEA